MGDMKDREHNTLSGDGLDEELSQIRDAFQQELEEATKRAEQEAEKNAQSGKEEAPPALPTSPVRAEGEAANAAVSAGEQKADWKVIVLAVICLAVGAAGGSAPKYLISAVLLLALGAVNFHGALKGGAEQELLRWTDERDRLVAMRSCQITLQVMNGLLFGGAMTALLCYAITRRALFQTVGITLCAVILTLFFVTMAANRYFERRM